jgi:hypothetical protein
VYVLPYPDPTNPMPSKKALKDAITLANVDVVFVVQHDPCERMRVSEIPLGESLRFQGPGAYNPKWYGKITHSSRIKGFQYIVE